MFDPQRVPLDVVYGNQVGLRVHFLESVLDDVNALAGRQRVLSCVRPPGTSDTDDDLVDLFVDAFDEIPMSQVERLEPSNH